VQLERHLLVLWRFRVVVTGGLLFGVLLAVLASYQVGWKDGSVLPGLTARGAEEWSAGSRVLVTQVGFPEGRVTLPGAEAGATGTEPQTKDPENESGIKFADPARFASLAALYASYVRSDLVRSRIPEKTEPEQIQAIPLDLNGSGDAFLPIVEISTTAANAKAASTLNRHTIRALRGFLAEEQARAKTPRDSRIRLDTLNDPRTALVSGRSYTGSILAFILCVIAAIALAHILESVLPPAPVALPVIRQAASAAGAGPPADAPRPPAPEPPAEEVPDPVEVNGHANGRDGWGWPGRKEPAHDPQGADEPSDPVAAEFDRIP
jgi:hypothetical protein